MRTARRHRGTRPLGVTRRSVLRAAASAAVAVMSWRPTAHAAETVSFGLTPVFLDNDIELLAMLEKYLVQQLRRPVQLVKRRTYQEITALLLSGQLDAAWICDDPYVQYEDKLSLLAVPLYHNRPLYQTYVVVNERSKAETFDETRGTVHAFSDPGQHLGLPDHALPAGASRDHARAVLPGYLLHLRPPQRHPGGRLGTGRERQHRRLRLGRDEGARARIHRQDAHRLPIRMAWLPAGRRPADGTRHAPISKAISAALLGMASDPLGREIL